MVTRARNQGEEDESYQAIHRIADRLEPSLRAGFLAAVEKVRNMINLDDLEHAIATSQASAAEIASQIDQLARELVTLQVVISRLVHAGGQVAAAHLSEHLGTEVTWGDANPFVLDWIQQHVASMVTEITNATRRLIQQRIEESFTQGIPPRQTAQRIYAEIGLTRVQGQRVDRFRASLEESGAAPAQIDRRVSRYTEAQLRYRATLIARTETINAANGGQELLWKEALQRGLLDYDHVHKVVITTPDDRLDTLICEPMPFMPENQNVHIGEPFTTGDGRQVMAPTFHPACRCAVGLEFD